MAKLLSSSVSACGDRLLQFKAKTYSLVKMHLIIIIMDITAGEGWSSWIDGQHLCCLLTTHFMFPLLLGNDELNWTHLTCNVKMTNLSS